MTRPTEAAAVRTVLTSGVSRARAMARGFAGHDYRASRRAAYATFIWVLVFLAWHVVWAITGLPFPKASDRQGTGLIFEWVYQAVLYVMVAVGIVLPLALAQRWGRRVPRWILLWAAWIGFALLSARGIMGIADDVARALGSSGGLTGMSSAQVMGTDHPSAWQSFASTVSDVIFVIGGLLFGLAALTYQRARPRRAAAPTSTPTPAARADLSSLNP